MSTDKGKDKGKYTHHIKLTQQMHDIIANRAAELNLTPQQFIANAINTYSTLKRHRTVYVSDDTDMHSVVHTVRLQVP